MHYPFPDSLSPLLFYLFTLDSIVIVSSLTHFLFYIQWICMLISQFSLPPLHVYFASYNSSALQRTSSFTYKRASGVSRVCDTDNMDPQHRSRTRSYRRYLRTRTAFDENTYNEKYSSQTGRSVWFLTDVLYLWCWADDRNSVQNGSLKPFASFGFMFFASMISMFNMIFGAWPTEIRRVMACDSRPLSTCTRTRRRRTEDSPETVPPRPSEVICTS